MENNSKIDAKLNWQYTRLRIADFGASFAISGLLAIVFKTMVAPLERIKLILQTQASSHQIGKAKRSAYSGFFNALIRIPQEQGFLSLWRGNLLSICRYFPSQAINFSFYDIYYDAFQQMIQPRTVHSENILPFLTGGAVGFTSSMLLYPLTFCNTRISVDVGDNKMVKREFHSLSDCLCKVYKNDGYRGFYQGLSVSAPAMFIFRSVYFGFYTIGKRTYLNYYTAESTSYTQQTPFLVSLVFAQLASIIATIIAYPLDTIARQKMLWSGRGSKNYVTIRQVVGTIVEKDGLVGFYRGIFANLLTTVCGSLILVTYDLVKGHYNRLKESKGLSKT